MRITKDAINQILYGVLETCESAALEGGGEWIVESDDDEFVIEGVKFDGYNTLTLSWIDIVEDADGNEQDVNREIKLKFSASLVR